VNKEFDSVEWGPSTPERIRIVPDDYHVPNAGTAADGRRFFVTDEVFDYTSGRQFVAVFLWAPTGEFEELRVDAIDRVEGIPPAQAVPSRDGGAVGAQLSELAPYVLEPIEVAPFEKYWDGVRFGFIEVEIDGEPQVHIEPGNFIAYYAPWDGEEYDT
jgi:hypothetical protein